MATDKALISIDLQIHRTITNMVAEATHRVEGFSSTKAVDLITDLVKAEVTTKEDALDVSSNKDKEGAIWCTLKHHLILNYGWVISIPIGQRRLSRVYGIKLAKHLRE